MLDFNTFDEFIYLCNPCAIKLRQELNRFITRIPK